MNQIKLKLNDLNYFVFDLDGTLLNSEHKISPFNLEQIARIKQANKTIFIASGRPYYMFLNIIKQLDIQTNVISCNGAIIYNPQQKAVVSHQKIFFESAKYIFDILVKNQATFVLYSTYKMFRYKVNSTSKWFDWLDHINGQLPADEKFDVEDINDVEKFNLDDYPVIKFLVVFNEMGKKQLNKILDAISFLNDIYTVRSQEGIFDIMPQNINKGNALADFAKANVLDLNQTLVFGDAENDLSMFAKAKYSVAMDQAKKEIKSKAKFITNSNNEDGVGKFLEKLK